MKKLLLSLSLIVFANIHTADAMDDWDFVVYEDAAPSQEEILGLDKILNPPTTNCEKIVRTHQLEVLNDLLQKKNHKVFHLIKKQLDTLPEDTWKLFLTKNKRLGEEWGNLTFEDAQRIAQPFNESLNLENPSKGFREAMKAHTITPGSSMLFDILNQEQEKKGSVQHFLEILAQYTSDQILFNLMRAYFNNHVDAAAYHPFAEKDIPLLTQDLEKTNLTKEKINAALEKLNWEEE